MPISRRPSGSLCRPRTACPTVPALLDDRHRLPQQQARPAHPLRGDRRRRHRALASDEGRRHALPDRHRRALGGHRREAPSQARTPAAFVDEMVALFIDAEDALASPGPVHPDHRPGPPRPPRRWSAERTPTATSTSARTRAGTAPTRASRPHATSTRRPDGMRCPNHPNVDAPVAHRAELVLPPFGVPGPAAAFEASRLGPAGLPPERDARLPPRGPRGHLDQPRDLPLGHPVPHRRERPDRAARDGSWDPEAGVIYVWFDALINYITGAGFPDDPEAFATGGRRTSTSSARTSTGSTRSSGRRCS